MANNKPRKPRDTWMKYPPGGGTQIIDVPKNEDPFCCPETRPNPKLRSAPDGALDCPTDDGGCGSRFKRPSYGVWLEGDVMVLGGRRK